MRLTETERRVMTAVWAQEGISAKELVGLLREQTGWNKATTYTVINRCIEKGYLRREDPDFHCCSLISHEQVSQSETDELLSDNFDNRPDLLVASLVDRKKLTQEQMEALYALLGRLTGKE